MQRCRLLPCLATAACLMAALPHSHYERVPDVRFLDTALARLTIVDDRADPYFAFLQPVEMAAKLGTPAAGRTLGAQRAEMQRQYQAAVLEFTAEEQEALRGFVTRLQPWLREYPALAQLPWRFVKVAEHVEGGLPHTRGDAIVLPADTVEDLVRLRARFCETESLARAARLLIHEQLHVLQRRDPARFESLYAEVYGFERVAPIALPAALRAQQVSNPDGQGCCWIYPLREGAGQRYLLPLLAFAARDGIARMPRDFRQLAVEVERVAGRAQLRHDAHGAVRVTDLRLYSDYTAAFPMTPLVFHPHEIAAEAIAKMVVFDHVGATRWDEAQVARLDKTYAPLRAWAQVNLD
jgi:hypothetical protein